MKAEGKNNRGAAIIEFAILLPLLAIIVFGIVEFGFIWLQSHYIANAAREGARIAAKLPDVDDVDEDGRPYVQVGVYNHLKGLYKNLAHAGEYELTSPTVDIEVDPPDDLSEYSGSPSGLTPEPQAVRVQVTVQTHEVWTPIIWGFLTGLFGGTEVELNEISESAVFVRE